MAGIGFELKKILRHETFISELAAYLYAATVSTGPWLISVITLAVLGIYRGGTTGDIDRELFRSTVIYAYAFSLIFIGIPQLVATRYLADRYYEKNIRITLSSFLTCAMLLLAAGAPLALAIYLPFRITWLHRTEAVLLFLVVTLIWLCMIFLSSIKDYISIVNGFIAGAVVSIAAAIYLGGLRGTEGYVGGYLAGQMVTLFWLLARLLAEFPAGRLWDAGLVRHFRKYSDLMWIGVGYNLAIWIDKMVFWVAPDSREIVPFFRTHDLYEAPMFFSYLTILPTLAMFLLKIETRFYEHYRRYYAKVVGKKDLGSILQEKALMVLSLKENLREVLIIQGTITVLCLIFAPDIVRLSGLFPLQIPIFRICLIGSFLNVLLSINIIVLFYFDFRTPVLMVSLLFLVLNGAFSYLTTRLGVAFYGYGYTYACMVALLLAFSCLHRRVTDLEYLTFSGQPVR